jgi:hypothetical protein
MSGRHVHPFVPGRRTGISAPSLAGKSMIVAFLEIDIGAALIAFWIFQDVERAGFCIVLFFVVVVVVSCFVSWATATVPKTISPKARVERVPSRFITVLLDESRFGEPDYPAMNET